MGDIFPKHNTEISTLGLQVSNVHMLKMLGRVEKFLGTPTFVRLSRESW